jgi:hypothetical protein
MASGRVLPKNYHSQPRDLSTAAAPAAWTPRQHITSAPDRAPSGSESLYPAERGETSHLRPREPVTAKSLKSLTRLSDPKDQNLCRRPLHTLLCLPLEPAERGRFRLSTHEAIHLAQNKANRLGIPVTCNPYN